LLSPAVLCSPLFGSLAVLCGSLQTLAVPKRSFVVLCGPLWSFAVLCGI